MALTSFSTTNYLRRLSQVFDTYPLLLSAWGNVPNFTAANVACVLGQQGQTFNRRAQLNTNGSSGTVNAQCTDASANVAAQTSVAPSLNTWFHMMGEFISTTSRAALLNGGSRGTDATSSNPGSSNSAYVGVLPDLGATYAGGLAEVSVWDGSGMTTANMDSLAGKLYNGGAGGAGGNPLRITAEVGQPWNGKLVAYWIDRYNTITDLSGKGNDLSMVGTLTNFSSHPNIESPRTRVLVVSQAVNRLGTY